VRQLIGRVVNPIVNWGEQGGYFADTPSREAFRDELTHLLVEQEDGLQFAGMVQRGSAAESRKCSACFINFGSGRYGIDHELLAKTEGMLFQVGLGHRHEFFHPARQSRNAFRRRHRLRTGKFHERF